MLRRLRHCWEDGCMIKKRKWLLARGSSPISAPNYAKKAETQVVAMSKEVSSFVKSWPLVGSWDLEPGPGWAGGASFVESWLLVGSWDLEPGPGWVGEAKSGQYSWDLAQVPVQMSNLKLNLKLETELMKCIETEKNDLRVAVYFWKEREESCTMSSNPLKSQMEYDDQSREDLEERHLQYACQEWIVLN